ncbi:MAG: hypothetical protein HKM07_00425 [Chlamydiae bacterium]|nr:hypothetical protein [Chlamydiota bacterium]
MTDSTLKYIVQTSFVTTGYQALYDWKYGIQQPLPTQGKPLGAGTPSSDGQPPSPPDSKPGSKAGSLVNRAAWRSSADDRLAALGRSSSASTIVVTSSNARQRESTGPRIVTIHDLAREGAPLAAPQMQGMQPYYAGQSSYFNQFEMTAYNASSVQMRAMGPMGGPPPALSRDVSLIGKTILCVFGYAALTVVGVVETVVRAFFTLATLALLAAYRDEQVQEIFDKSVASLINSLGATFYCFIAIFPYSGSPDQMIGRMVTEPLFNLCFRPMVPWLPV